MGYEKQAKEQIVRLTNLDNGRGTRIFCQTQCRNIRIHECGNLFQFNVMINQTSTPMHFPCIPVMLKDSRTPDPQPMEIDVNIQAIRPALQPAKCLYTNQYYYVIFFYISWSTWNNTLQ